MKVAFSMIIIYSVKTIGLYHLLLCREKVTSPVKPLVTLPCLCQSKDEISIEDSRKKKEKSSK